MDDAEDRDVPDTDDRPPRRLRWGVWVLAVAALLQPVVLAVAVLNVLSGSLDARYFSVYSTGADGTQTVTLQPGITFWQRWSVITFTVPADRAVLGPTAVVVALAVVHLVGRRPLPRGVRWTAVAAAGLSSLLALASVVVLLLLQSRPEDETGYYSSRSTLVDVGAPAAAVGLAVVFAVLAAVVLLGPVAPAPPPGPEPRSEPRPEPRPEPDVDPVEEPGPDPAQVGVAPEPPGREPVPAGLPTPSPEEYAWYRRP
ncbi:hypothetical protein [Kineococcus rhizosphaerae]|uniref:Uncharacterized protein n=1 Tax=Kineococcus rhizosphaerae TaxID=559628 RepID=A0A2T0R617_9ACTN|nr:hypothetical protein [Kineococcus rhizosphaerae]PRY16615.1 hypothetical protein CLV37_10346 [Kineococcus rhizosphaerae]